MSSADKPPVSYFTIWIYLVVLVALGLAFLAAPFSHTLAVVLIFGVALLKAFLVLRHYMHVREVPGMLYAMITVPLILAILLVILLMPDIALHQRQVPESTMHEATH
jgi:caa(3)-type oxidase subunit IV